MVAEKVAVLNKHLDNTPPALVVGDLVAVKGPVDGNGMSTVTITSTIVIGPRPDAEHDSLVSELG